MDPLYGTQFTDDWMQNPWGTFDQSQLSNKFSQYNNGLSYPPTLNEGLAGGPVDAATGKPLQAYQDWKAANPGGTTINNTPAQPAAQQSQYPQGIYTPGAAQQLMGGMQQGGSIPLSQLSGGVVPQQNAGGGGGGWMQGAAGNPQGSADASGLMMLLGMDPSFGMPQQQAQAQPQQAQAQPSGPPNNWQAALNAMAKPPDPVTQGATVPMVQGYQPAGGINQAFMGQAGGGGNPRFMSALAAIQGRPQQGFG